ncbi:hypothetical protein [Aeoliella mucimassa]|uniref:Uncharacterized protein n=1 Tax=Aeoliella mucimassa TaxID=2527972 RepID=A0A518AWS0_9BACT|nr:hypothetical protein [Aeoliella mucimassa]QDU59158.1 hypothetical protein Pan181_53990 [Aeoliella mucimassa]
MVQATETLDSTRIDYLPSPHDIHAACEQIRENWTLSERRRRFVGPQLPEELPQPWQPPMVDTSGFRLAAARATSE